MNKSSELAKGGIFTALTLILLYLTSIIPTSKIALLTLASALIPFSIISLGYKSSILIYLSSSILAFLFVDKKIAFMYVSFLGVYGFIKNLAEKINNIYIEIILKVLFFNVFLIIFYYLYKILFLGYGDLNFSKPLIIILSEIIFLIYDYGLTLIISFYIKKFKGKGM